MYFKQNGEAAVASRPHLVPLFSILNHRELSLTVFYLLLLTLLSNPMFTQSRASLYRSLSLSLMTCSAAKLNVHAIKTKEYIDEKNIAILSTTPGDVISGSDKDRTRSP